VRGHCGNAGRNRGSGSCSNIAERTGRIEGAWDAWRLWRLWTPGGCGRREAADAGRLRTPGGCGWPGHGCCRSSFLIPHYPVPNIQYPITNPPFTRTGSKFRGAPNRGETGRLQPVDPNTTPCL
jgi:hypothetical protein